MKDRYLAAGLATIAVALTGTLPVSAQTDTSRPVSGRYLVRRRPAQPPGHLGLSHDYSHGTSRRIGWQGGPHA